MIKNKIDLLHTTTIQALITLLILAVDAAGARENVLSLLAGSAISLVNYSLLWYLWSFVFNKKNIALIIAVVVIKYSILILVLLKVSKTPWVNGIMFSLGILTNFIAIFTYGLTRKHLIKLFKK